MISIVTYPWSAHGAETATEFTATATATAYGNGYGTLEIRHYGILTDERSSYVLLKRSTEIRLRVNGNVRLETKNDCNIPWQAKLFAACNLARTRSHLCRVSRDVTVSTQWHVKRAGIRICSWRIDSMHLCLYKTVSLRHLTSCAQLGQIFMLISMAVLFQLWFFS